MVPPLRTVGPFPLPEQAASATSTHAAAARHTKRIKSALWTSGVAAGSGQLDGEFRALARFGDDGHLAAVGFHHVAHDRQPEARALTVALARAVRLPEALEDAVQVRWINADAGVAAAQHHAALKSRCGVDVDAAAGRRELDR